jgi:hypothetical protein
MSMFKTYRIALGALLGVVVMAAMSLLPGSLGTQIAGAAPVVTLNLSASPSSTVTSGTPVTVSADLEGATTPTGDISMSVFLNDSSCFMTSPVYGQDVAVTGSDGTYSFAPKTEPVGTYYGAAFYADNTDSSNDVGSGCVLLYTVTPALADTSLTLSAAPNPAPSGTPVTFTADLEGGSSPTGTISLAAYLNDPSCSLPTPTFSEDVPVTGSNGDYNFAPVTPAAGSYYGEAFYTGDTSNASASSGSCDLILVVNPPTPSLTYHLTLWWLPFVRFILSGGNPGLGGFFF